MKNDPIVTEVRKARAAIVRESGNNLARLFDRLRQQECETERPRSASKPVRKSRTTAR
jgi:hypothetical protein